MHASSIGIHIELTDSQACYLQDGGYHVEVAHPDLAAGLDLPSYRSELYERVSIQSCAPKAAAAEPRLGELNSWPLPQDSIIVSHVSTFLRPS